MSSSYHLLNPINILRTLVINSNQIVLSFGVLIVFLSPKQSEIEESSLESISKSGHTIRGRRNVGCGIAHSTRMSHIRNYALPTFHPDVSYPEFCSVNIPPGCLTSGILLRRHSIRIFRIRRLTPNGRGGRFNFLGQTYPNLLIALIRRVSNPILHSAAVFS